MVTRRRGGLVPACLLALLGHPASALCVEVLDRPADLGPMVDFGYDAPALAHFLQAGPTRAPWVFDGEALRPRAGETGDGLNLPPPGGYASRFAAPETEDGKVFALMRQPGDGQGPGDLTLFLMNDATREFEPVPFRGPVVLDPTDAIWSALFGGSFLIGAQDGVYSMTPRYGTPEIGALSTVGGPGGRRLVDLPALEAVLVILSPPSDAPPARRPALFSVLSERGLRDFDLPVSKTGWLPPRPLRLSGIAALAAPPGLVFAEAGDRGTESFRFVALSMEDGTPKVSGTSVTEGHDHRVSVLGGAGFTLGGQADREIAAGDIRIFDGSDLRPLTPEERGELPTATPLRPAYGIGTLPRVPPAPVIGLTDGARLYTYAPGQGFVETPVAPGAGPGPIEGSLWYAPGAALSVDKTEGAARVIGPDGGSETVALTGLSKIRILPRHGEVLILDEARLHVATAGPCGP